MFSGISIPQCGHFAPVDDSIRWTRQFCVHFSSFGTLRKRRKFERCDVWSRNYVSVRFRARSLPLSPRRTPPKCRIPCKPYGDGCAGCTGARNVQCRRERRLRSPSPQPASNFKSAVNSGDADPRVVFLDQPMEFINREMFASLQKCSQDRAALFRLLQAARDEDAEEKYPSASRIFSCEIFV